VGQIRQFHDSGWGYRVVPAACDTGVECLTAFPIINQEDIQSENIDD
jgi:hypothetical protein